MCHLIESIKVKENKLCNINYHNERLNYARKIILGAKDTLDLDDIITIPELNPDLVYKCRVIYGEKVKSIEFNPYEHKRIKYLKIVEANNIDYSFKYSDRQFLDNLKKANTNNFETDILIVKNGFITDTSFSNIVFYDGYKWYTPSTPLLKGTKRSYYIMNKIVSEMVIMQQDIQKFSKARLINAMIDLEESSDIPVTNIFT